MSEESVNVTTDKTLPFLGILRALKGFPGQFAVVAWCIALAEAVYLSLGIPADSVPVSNQQVIVVLTGAVVGVVAYTAGNFWDRVVFDRLYGPEGTRREMPASTFFPSGRDLTRARSKAIETVQSSDSDGEGIYRDSKDIVSADEEEWNAVEEPVVLSKIVRAFIWPCVLAAIGCGLVYFVGPALGWYVNAALLLSIGFISACFAALLFIPYFEYRVEHMIRLYRAATRMRT